jgi:hypothetical protein
LERAVVHRVSAADIKGFNRVVAALEQEAHQRVGSRGARPSRKRKKAAP